MGAERCRCELRLNFVKLSGDEAEPREPSTSKGVPDENTRKCRSRDKIDNRQYREKSFEEIFKLLGGEPTSKCADAAFCGSGAEDDQTFRTHDRIAA